MRLVAGSLILAAVLAAPAAAQSVHAPVDQVVRVKLARPADTIVLGNPSIADVVVHDGTTLFITGKAAGATNLMVLDADGGVVLSSPVQVGYARHGRLVLNRGAARQSYACAGTCEPVPTPGDASEATQALLDARRGLIAAAREEAEAQ